MKAQYLGDVNDYFKFGLLRALTGGSDLVLTVAWMLTLDDGGPDGRKLGYLNRPREWQALDEELLRRARQLPPGEGSARRFLALKRRDFCRGRATSRGCSLTRWIRDAGTSTIS